MDMDFVIMLNWNVLAIIDTDKSKMYPYGNVYRRVSRQIPMTRGSTSRAFLMEDLPRVLHLNRACRASAMTRIKAFERCS